MQADEAPSRSIVLRAPEGEVGWTLIELQGSIEPRNGTTSLDDLEFGTLEREVSRCASKKAGAHQAEFARRVPWQEGEAPKLIMGKMQLEGELVKLKKPLAIMSLVKQDDGATEYHTAGVVRQKVVFKTRPVPQILKAAGAAAESICGAKRARAEVAA